MLQTVNNTCVWFPVKKCWTNLNYFNIFTNVPFCSEFLTSFSAMLRISSNSLSTSSSVRKSTTSGSSKWSTFGSKSSTGFWTGISSIASNSSYSSLYSSSVPSTLALSLTTLSFASSIVPTISVSRKMSDCKVKNLLTCIYRAKSSF